MLSTSGPSRTVKRNVNVTLTLTSDVGLCFANMNRNLHGTICIYVFFAVLILFPACESSRTRLIGSKAVRNIKERYALYWGCPIPGRPAGSYWVYNDPVGRAIKHGPYQHFSGEGRLDYEANFLDGKQDGTATLWNPRLGGRLLPVRDRQIPPKP